MLGHLFRVAHSVLREKLVKEPRSDKWPTVEKHKRAAVPACEVCGSIVRLQVHHVEPFHLHPELELDPNNLVVLCMDKNECHLLLGHGGSFRAYNPNIREVIASAKVGKAIGLLQIQASHDRIKMA